jgi:hypothetical protein
MSLTAAELGRGWVEFVCDEHGFLVATTPSAIVRCKCRKRAYPTRHGMRLGSAELKRIKSSAKSLQTEGSRSTKRPLSAKRPSAKRGVT